MPRQQLGLLSFGVFVVIVAVLLVAFAPSQDWGSFFSLTLVLYGLWVIVLAGIRVRTPEKYGRGAFSILVWGILLLAVGGAWYLNILTEGNILYSVVLLLVIIGILAVASALPSMRKKS